MTREDPETTDGERRAQGATVTIVIEDDEPLCALFEISLRRAGHEVHAFASGEGALGSLQSGRRIHAAIVDRNLPDMLGEEVIRRLREHPETRSATIIATTADADPALRSRLLSAGADHFLPKPVDIVELARLVGPAGNGDPLSQQPPTGG